jgi:chorismate mutase
VDTNTKEAILAASRELLDKMVTANEVDVDDIAGVWFTTTPDINAEFPAVAARELGWLSTALICGHEMDVPGGLSKCLRVLMLVNTEKKNEEIAHIYLRGAEVLRAEATNSQKDGKSRT